MDLNQVLFGIIQGATEWLPISSSGHLLIFTQVMGLSFPIGFFTAVHLGTLFSVLIYFRKDIFEILKSLNDFKSDGFKFAMYVIAGNLTTAIIALMLKNYVDYFFNIKALPYAFIFSGMLILISWRRRGSGKIDFKKALIIGAFQGISVIPGISRSGATISSALIIGVKAEEAFKFSFLLSIPAIIGANILEMGTMDYNVILPMMAAFISGCIAIHVVKKFLKNFHLFSTYCFLIGAILLWIFD